MERDETRHRVLSELARPSALAPFRYRNYRFQWPADLLTSWAFEMETLILGWYVLVETGSVLLLTLFASLTYVGTLIAPMFGVVGDRIGHRDLLAMMRATYAVTHHAEYRRNQSADEIERRKNRQQQHRSGLDQHVPAENERLHLESPRGEQIGRPLETVIPNAEGSERGRPRRPAQNSMPRFIAFHPALFLILPESGFPGAGSYSQRRDTALLFPVSITAALTLNTFKPPIMRISL